MKLYKLFHQVKNANYAFKVLIYLKILWKNYPLLNKQIKNFLQSKFLSFLKIIN